MLLFLQPSHLGSIKHISTYVSSINNGIIKKNDIPILLSSKNDNNNIMNTKYEVKLLTNLSNIFMLLFLVLMNIYLSNYYVIITF